MNSRGSLLQGLQISHTRPTQRTHVLVGVCASLSDFCGFFYTCGDRFRVFEDFSGPVWGRATKRHTGPAHWAAPFGLWGGLIPLCVWAAGILICAPRRPTGLLTSPSFLSFGGSTRQEGAAGPGRPPPSRCPGPAAVRDTFPEVRLFCPPGFQPSPITLPPL